MRASRVVLVVAVLLALPSLTSGQEAATSPAVQETTGPPAYVGSDQCKSCHQAIHASWMQTKHARAIDRLSTSERNRECIGCHVTGSAEQIAREKGHPSHPNVQCESCHGPASLHAANPEVKTGIVKKPAASSCERCHNERSPHFRGFVYSGMVHFVHPVK